MWKKCIQIRKKHEPLVAAILSKLHGAGSQRIPKMSCHSEATLKYLKKSDSVDIPYRKTDGVSPGVIFIPGFLSNMTGQKAVALEKYCKDVGHSYVRFDNVGLGSSKCDLPLMAGAMDQWYSDVVTVLDQLTEGLQILVGSSLGALSMLLLAMDRPDRIHALVGVASAYWFEERKIPIEPSYVKENTPLPEQDHTSIHELLSTNLAGRLKVRPLPVKCPMRLVHGIEDDVVPYQCSVDLASAVQSSDVDVYLRKSADHRFSHEEDIQFLVRVVSDLMTGDTRR